MYVTPLPVLNSQPLRILQIVETAATGVGRHVCDLCLQLCRLGHHVHLVYSSLHPDRAFLSGLNTCGAFPHFQSTPIPMRHAPHPTDLLVMRSLHSLIRNQGPFHLAHCHSTKAGMLGRLVCAASGVPAVYTPHAMMTLKEDLPFIIRKAARGYERLFAGLTRTVVAVSSAEFQHALQLGIPRARLKIVHNGLNSPSSSCSRPAPAGTITVGFVGRLSRQKNLPLLLRAFARASRQSDYPCRLVIVGDGPEGAHLRELSAGLGLESRVEWWGECDGPSAMSSFDIFALSSEYEGFPYVLLEAMYLGLPVVTTEIGGASELVGSTSSGMVVPVGDTGAFAAALSSLIGSQILRIKFGTAARISASAFSIERMVNELLDVYTNVLPQPRRIAQLANTHPAV